MAFKASQDYTCFKCDNIIEKGSDYTWSRKGVPKYYHIACANPLDRILEDDKPENDNKFDVTCENCGLLFPFERVKEGRCLDCQKLKSEDVEWMKGEIEPETKQLEDRQKIPTLRCVSCHRSMAGNLLKDGHCEICLKHKEERKPMDTKLGKLDFVESLSNLIGESVDERIKALDMKVDNLEVEKQVKEAVEKLVKPSVEIRIREKTETKVIEGIRHKQYAALLYLLANRQHVYLYGPSGSGKTMAAQQASEDLKLTYGYLSLNPQTPDSRIIGCRYADGEYRGTKFREAYELGHLYCFDEIDNASSALMATLNSALANGVGAFPDKMVTVHDNFKLVVTGNTAGYGANPAFPERRPLDAAIRDRFCFLLWDYDQDMEWKIASGINRQHGPLTKWCQLLRAWALENMPKLQVTSRAIYRLASLSVDKFGPLGIKGALDTTIFKGIDTASIKQVLASNPLPN